MLAWLIVGGGVHGTYLSHYLTVTGRAARDRLRVLDPHAVPLARWHRWTANTATEWLRSPDSHHLDVDDDALARFAVTPVGRAAGDLAGRRPATRLFAAHVDAIVSQHALATLRIVGTATGLARRAGGWRVETTSGALDARRVVLAIGPDDRVREPVWTRALRALGARVEHVLAPEFQRDLVGPRERIAVVGGGISAAQLAIALARRAPGNITLITRHPPRLQALDADPIWFERWTTPEFARGDHRRRRALLGFGRHPGSMPRDVADRLVAATRSGRLTVHIGEVSRASALPGGASKLATLQHDIEVDRVVLATGFDPARPGSWLARSILDAGLPIAPCGYPIADAQLAWQPGLHVCGPLGELQLGAAARSIAGARRAAEILGTVA